ncbi:hypothetical protein V2J93_17130 [Pseudomonas alliivorans]|nr:hypothetical protein [Pseudomonas alliivorans]
MTVDIEKLEAAALAATPGRNFDRLPEAGGGLKYECTGDDGSLVLKVDHKNDEWGFVGENGEADEAFFLACTPAAVLELIANYKSSQKHCENESNNVQALMAEVSKITAENAGLKTGYEAYERVNAELRAENEALRQILSGSHEFILNDARTRHMCDETGQVSPMFPKRFGILAAIDTALSKDASHE